MKKIEWRDGNHMVFVSPHKEINRQTQCISTGNVIANTQYSNFIRPFHEVECNGRINEPGHLQNYDLTENFVAANNVHSPFNLIREEIRKLTHTNGGIIYDFHHWRLHRRIIDGFVLTTKHPELRLIEVWYINPNWKARAAVDEAIKYVTN